MEDRIITVQVRESLLVKVASDKDRGDVADGYRNVYALIDDIRSHGWRPPEKEKLVTLTVQVTEKLARDIATGWQRQSKEEHWSAIATTALGDSARALGFGK